MRNAYLVLFGLGAIAAGPAQAKGFLASGTYEGTGQHGKSFRISLAIVNIDSSTTVVTGCNFDPFCDRVARKTVSDGRRTVTILDLYGTAETYEPSKWGVTYGMIGPRRVYYPLFTMHIRNPMDQEITLTFGSETVRLKRTP
jgi:hypothetical protein